MESQDNLGNPESILARCEQILDYRFQDRNLLQRSLTHSSISVTRLDSNERMEFLGDSILGMVVCEMLYSRFPDCPEGEMTRIKSAVVSRSYCAKISREIGLDQCLFLGKGLTVHEKIPQSVIAGCFEAVVGALYLDGGLAVAQRFLEQVTLGEIERLALESTEENHKSRLQQIAQRDFQFTPEYQLLDEQGPDHSKSFKVSAQIGPETYPAAWGRTKKEAEQRAAKNALCVLEGETPCFDAG